MKEQNNQNNNNKKEKLCRSQIVTQPKLIKTPSRATFLLFDAVMSRKRKRNEDDEEEKEAEESDIEEAKEKVHLPGLSQEREANEKEQAKQQMGQVRHMSKMVPWKVCWYHKETWEEWDELGDAAPDWYCGCAEHPAPYIAHAAAPPPPDIAAPPSPSVLAPYRKPFGLTQVRIDCMLQQYSKVELEAEPRN